MSDRDKINIRICDINAIIFNKMSFANEKDNNYRFEFSFFVNKRSAKDPYLELTQSLGKEKIDTEVDRLNGTNFLITSKIDSVDTLRYLLKKAPLVDRVTNLEKLTLIDQATEEVERLANRGIKK